ncbi:hypothetical protein [Georgenia thermotolerans]|nr:hypothetical protein [Georgenia thermotolerans]
MYLLDGHYPTAMAGAETIAVLALVVTLVLHSRAPWTVQRSRLRSAARCFGWAAGLIAPLVLALLGVPGVRDIVGAMPELAWFAVPMYALVTVLVFAAGVGWCVAAAWVDSGSREVAARR